MTEEGISINLHSRIIMYNTYPYLWIMIDTDMYNNNNTQ